MDRENFSHCNIALSVASSGSGAPFLFQHGLCGDANQTADVFPLDSGYTCFTMECRGHGLSQSEQDTFSLAQFTDDIAAWIEKMSVGPLPVGGISMGAAITMRLAVIRPELVKALVLARPAWIDQPAPKNLGPNAEVADLLAKFSPEDALNRFKASDTFSLLQREAPDNLASLVGFFEKGRAANTRPLLQAVAKDGPGVSREDIMAISCPTLVIGNKYDAIHPLEMAMKLADLIPAARFAEITSKAESPLAYRAEFRAALRQFMTEIK